MCGNERNQAHFVGNECRYPRALVFGSLNLDHVYAVDHIVTAGETLSSAGLRQSSGGKGLNQAIALAKAGADTSLAGRIGSDGEGLRDVCRQSGVSAEHIQVSEVPTGNTIIQVDRNGQNCILLFGGANRTQTKEQIDQTLACFQSGDYLFLQNEINHLPYLIEQAYARGMHIVLNPSPFEKSLLQCDLQKLSWLIVNEVEGFQMTGQHAPQAILDRLQAEYPGVNLVLTMGKDGSMCVRDGQVYQQACCQVTAVDTTAAGDTFTGYFFAQIMAGGTVERALAMASQAAAITVSRPGAADSIPNAEEVVQVMKGER